MLENKTDPKRRALGKGLESLLPSRATAEVPGAAAGASTDGKPREIPVADIDRNPYQTRSGVDEQQLEELARSIAATGVVQPIIVRPLPNGRFQLIAGERRWLASKKIGNATVPAIVRQVSNEQALEMTIVENLQRADLNAMEQARAFDRLGREFNMTQEQVATRTGKERGTVANYLRLMRLPEAVQTVVESGAFSFGHARALLALGASEEILKAANKILHQHMSVRQAENYIQGLLNPENKPADPTPKEREVDPNVRAAEHLIQRNLGLRVKIEDKRGRGRVIIEYSGIDDFDLLLSALIGQEVKSDPEE